MIVLLLAALLLAPGPIDLLRLSENPLGAHLPMDWRLRRVRGAAAPDFAVVEDSGGRALRISGRGAAAWAYLRLPRAVSAADGTTLRWSARVLQAPAGADLRDPARDDSPLRVFVVFGDLGGDFASAARIVFYTWGGSEPPGHRQASFVSDRFHVIRVAGLEQADGQWHDRAAEPFADYQEIWGRKPPEITAVGLMQDGDQTGASAVAEVRRLLLEPPDRP